MLNVCLSVAVTLVVVTGTAGDYRCSFVVAQHVLPNTRVGKASPLPHFTGSSSTATGPPPAGLFEEQKGFCKGQLGQHLECFT